MALAKLQNKVGVADLDICGPSMIKMLAVEGMNVVESSYGWTPLRVRCSRRVSWCRVFGCRAGRVFVVVGFVVVGCRAVGCRAGRVSWWSVFVVVVVVVVGSWWSGFVLVGFRAGRVSWWSGVVLVGFVVVGCRAGRVSCCSGSWWSGFVVVGCRGGRVFVVVGFVVVGCRAGRVSWWSGLVVGVCWSVSAGRFRAVGVSWWSGFVLVGFRVVGVFVVFCGVPTIGFTKPGTIEVTEVILVTQAEVTEAIEVAEAI
eukprot:Em0001g1430a